jgi:hypothetical protein
MLVTEWLGCDFSSGVLMIQFASGPEVHTLALGPPTARTGIAIMKEAMRSGMIARLDKHRKESRKKPPAPRIVASSDD